MLNKIFYWLERVNPFWLIIPYVFIQSFLYFSAYIHTIGGSFYYIVWDPELFSRDLLKTSTLGTATLFYKFMHVLLGQNMVNPYCLFWVYLVSCGLTTWAVFLFGKYISGGNSTVGVVALILLLVEKTPITGAYISIMHTDYGYQHFALPFILFAIYFFFKERYCYFGLLMAGSLYFHLKSPAGIVLALAPYLLYQIIKNPRILLSFVLPAIVVVPKILSMAHDLYASGGFTGPEKMEYMNLMIPREGIEGGMFFDEEGILVLIGYVLFALFGIWSARFVEDPKLRGKIYWCHGGVFFAFGIGCVVRVIDHFYGPLGEVVVLGYSRASILGVLLTIATMSEFFYKKAKRSLAAKNPLQVWLAVFLLFLFAMENFYFPYVADIVNKFGPKLISKSAFFIVASSALVLLLKKRNFDLTVRAFVTALMIISLAFVGVKGVMMVQRSYKAHYPYAPFVPDFALFNLNIYEAGQWAQKNTPKDALFLALMSDQIEEKSFCIERFRIPSLRSAFCQGFPSTYGSASAFREWKRRRSVLHEYFNRPLNEWAPLLGKEKIDYVLSPKNMAWPQQCKKVYENPQFDIYKVNEIKGWN